MQDEDLQFMIRNAEMSLHDMACRSFSEGGTLWRRMVQNGLYQRTGFEEMDRAFFTAISSHDADGACELVRAACTQNPSHNTDWLNSWFYANAFEQSSVSDRIAEIVVEGAVGPQTHPPTLLAVLRTLHKCGLNLAVTKPIGVNRTRDETMLYNGLHSVVFQVQLAESEEQLALIDIARAYLQLGVSAHKSAGGIEESPLAILLRSGDVEMIAPWVSMLVDEGHVRQEHLNKFRKVDSIIPAHLAMFDAHLARRQIQDIAAAAKGAGRTASP